MSNKCEETGSPIAALKNKAARQRWELFHRAIAYAKQSNDAALENSSVPLTDPDECGAEADTKAPALSVVR